MAGVSSRILGFVLLATLFSGCGYKLVRYAEAPGDARRIALLPLVNDSLEPGIDTLLLDAFHREFLRRGGLRIVEDPASADLIVGGVIESLESNGRSFSSIQFALEYQLRIRLDLEVTRPDGTPVPLDGRAFNESELYLSSADLEVTRTNREEAMRRLAGVLATRLHDVLYERIRP
ncbi:MAG: hypothetical protein JRH01_08320 [Deltaproteobacteria bacterium]|nr:hypothetical protein [Deltaproteobacteria bacterium]MBW2392982.1 hypothetical protein [Deltaproteobacteria bacterium]